MQVFCGKTKLVLPVIQGKYGICLALGYSLPGVNTFFASKFCDYLINTLVLIFSLSVRCPQEEVKLKKN